MKILIIISGFYPAKNYGGPAVSVKNFTNLLGKDYKCYILTRDCEFGTNEKLRGVKKGWNDIFNAKVMYVDRKEFKGSFFKDIVEKNKFGWKCYSNDADEFRALVKKISRFDEAFLRKMGFNGVKYLDEHYDSSKNCESIISFLGHNRK